MSTLYKGSTKCKVPVRHVNKAPHNERKKKESKHKKIFKNWKEETEYFTKDHTSTKDHSNKR